MIVAYFEIWRGGNNKNMKMNVGFSLFCDRFREMGRKDQFSYNGLHALYDHLVQYEAETGEEIELDVIALCCDYSEHKSALDCIKDNGYLWELILGESVEDTEARAREYLREHTQLIEFDNGVIIQGF